VYRRRDHFIGTLGGIADGTLVGGNWAHRPDLVWQLNIHIRPNPGGDANHLNLITNSGLAQPLIDYFGPLGTHVVRLTRSFRRS
jgi:hypothetical protein